MPEYMYRLWRSGLCPNLVPAGLYEDGAGLHVLLRAEGLIRVREYAVLCPDGIEAGFCTLLTMLASAAEGFSELQHWLADPAYISLRPEDLYYDGGKEKTLLVLSEEPDPRPFLQRFCGMCAELGGSGSLIALKLEENAGCRIMEEKGAAAFLRRWREEILSGL